MNESAFSLSAADLAVIVGSLVLTVVVGLWAGRKREDTAQGYFLASGRLPWWIIGSAFVSTSISSEQIVGTVGKAYSIGMGVANWEWFTLPMYAPLVLFFVPMYLHSRVTTIPEFLTRRYGPDCGTLYSWTMLVAYVLIFLVVVVYSGAIALADLTGWNFYAIVWGMIVLVGLYSVKGGLASVMWTDAVQCLMLVGGGVLLYFLALRQIPGGWTAMVKASPDRFHLYQPPDDANAPFLGLVCASFGVYLFYSSTNQVMVQRILSARSTWDGMMGIVFAGFINLIRPLVTCFLGFIVFHWIHVMQQAPLLPKGDKGDYAFSFSLKTFASTYGLRGVVLAGFLAAVMSTISALANSTATIFSLDVYKKFLRPGASERDMVRVGQTASLVSLIVAGLVCPVVGWREGIFDYFQTGVAYLAIPFVSVFLLGVFWKRANYAGGRFGMMLGIGLAALGLTATILKAPVHMYYLACGVQVIAMTGAIVASLVTPPPTPGQWEPFTWRPSLLRQYNEGRVRPWWQSLWLWFGLYAAIWCYLYWRYW